MVKATCVILGLAFLVLGIMGITGAVPMFNSNPIYVNIGEIVLGALGFIVGIYARQKGDKGALQEKENYQQRKENYDQQKNENDRLRKENELQRKENELQRRANYSQWRKENDPQRKENT